ncbi:hypothetical protein ACERII_03120 [Evansella sp. AB-rgal1]|uniref:hypothetical protein n=1 Tax=Evansella sp. AB-rgal1 TaxID=3242696 RepID=UPI00359E65C1
MKKRTIIIITLLLLLLSIPFLLWFTKEEHELHVVIIDKTVPDDDKREHKGLTWLLNYEKYVHQTSLETYSIDDYYGFFPLDDYEYEIKELPPDLENLDLIYIADTYGVFHEEYYEQSTSGDRSEKVYGGISVDEIETIKGYLYDQKTTLVAEFNSFASPTSYDARSELTNLLSLDWTGWIGRYFQELDRESSDEVPAWAVEQYEAQHNSDWDFSDGGYILIHEDDTIVVLEENIHVGSQGINVAFTEKGQDMFNLHQSPRYYYWFDIITPQSEEDIVATYNWDLTEEGATLLRHYDIPTTFPAIVHSTSKGFTSYYFAGDYVDIKNVPSFYQIAGYPTFKKWFTLDRIGSTEAFYWKTYVPLMQTLLHSLTKEVPSNDSVLEPFEDETGLYSARIQDQVYEVYVDNEWKELTIKGINLGIAKPGYWPGETAITEDEYYRWFQLMGEMNANSIRVYTLHPPGFYRALERYNRSAEEPLYLFHGVWIGEEGLEETLDAFDPENIEPFKEEITYVIDAIHGNIQLPENPGHASGTYTANIAPYVIGWILGIEWYPEMVLNTNEHYASLGDYEGNHIYTEGAEPFEYWLAEIFDYTLEYEHSQYRWHRPISFTNWVTTDLLEHPSEPSLEEDLVGVNPNTIFLKDHMRSGQFASYHVYPYYPDFLNYDPDYINYIDHRGEPNNFAAYLKDLHAAHTMPVLVAEFGVPSSRGLTHENPFGWNQGFLSEQEQGEINARLFEDIVYEGMLGGLVFAWQDEWFKRTWNTMELDSPYRRPYWSDAQTNEQNFGLVSFDSLKIPIRGVKEDWTTSPLYEGSGDEQSLRGFYVDHDERYLYLRIDVEGLHENNPFENVNLLVAIDSIKGQGITDLPFDTNISIENGGIDFLIHLNGIETSRILVDSYYDLFHFQYGHELGMIPDLAYASEKNNGVFHPIELVTSKEMVIPTTNEVIPFTSYETGKLRHGIADPSSDEYDSLADFYVSDDMIELRIPWGLLHVKDPSLKEVAGDIWSDGFEASEFIEGMSFAVISYKPDKDGDNETGTNGVTIMDSFPSNDNGRIDASQMESYNWNIWEIPSYQERLKPSYFILQELFRNY